MPAEGEADTLGHIFIIGAMKSGTTSLHFLLCQDPAISEHRLKEMNYFGGAGGNPALYHKRFRYRPGLTRYTIESSTNYSKLLGRDGREDHRIPRRIARLQRPVRLIYILRDPVDRAESHLGHSIAHGRVSGRPASLDWLAATSSYARQIDIWRRHFGPDRMLLCTLDELREAPEMLLGTIRAFLGLPAFPHEFPPPKKVRASREPLLDRAQRAELARMLIDDTTRLATEYGVARAWHWRAAMDETIRTAETGASPGPAGLATGEPERQDDTRQTATPPQPDGPARRSRTTP